MEENNVKTKKPFWKKWWFIVGIIVISIAIIIGIILLTNGNETQNNSNITSNNKLFSNQLKAKDLSIEDFEWEATKIRVDGKETYGMSLTNKSDYPIFAIQFDYKTKEIATEDDLNVYSDFMKEHAEYIEEDDSAKGVILRGKGEKLVKTGEAIDGIHFTIGYNNWSWYDYPTEEQFNLMEPKELQIGIIGKDNIAYIAYYNFENKEWTLEEETKATNTWPNNEISKKIEKPTCDYYILTTDMDDKDLDFIAYGITKDQYKSYTESLKNVGFYKDVSNSNSYFSAEDEQGNEVSVYYYSESEKLSVNISVNTEITSKKEEVSNNNTSETSVKKEETNTVNFSDTNSSNLGTEFKEAMDSYEAFMNEYVEFMKKYKANPTDQTLLSQYATMLQKYSEQVSAFNEWNSKEMTAEDAAYYIDVQSRVSKKLLEVSQ